MSCDSGMIPWFLVAAHVSKSPTRLRDLISSMRPNFRSSGEVNLCVTDSAQSIEPVLQEVGDQAVGRDKLDGLS